jgi:hypothetical protein
MIVLNGASPSIQWVLVGWGRDLPDARVKELAQLAIYVGFFFLCVCVVVVGRRGWGLHVTVSWTYGKHILFHLSQQAPILFPE